MRKISITVRKSCNVLISALLTLLGFTSSCDIADEYGTPSAKFIVNGKVTSSETKQPIENIRVVMQGDTAYSNHEGQYQVADEWGFPTDQTYLIKFQDVDGEANAAFTDLDTIAEFENPEFTGGDGDWYRGETSQDLDVELSPKE